MSTDTTDPAVARALQYAAEGDARAATIDDLPAGTQAAAFARLGIVGAGTMGTGIAISALNAGLPTVLVESRADALDAARKRIAATLDGAVKKGRIDAAERDRRLALLSCATTLEALASVDVVIEAVFEDLAVKQGVFRQLDAIVRPGALLASNTSTLDVDLIASATARPADVIGLHFFSPANIMRLLEVIRGRQTSPQALATAMALARRLGKVAVVARVCDGFIGNRMFEEYLRQAYFLLDEGLTPRRVDTALEQWGMAMGPFAVMDLAGGDIGWAIRKRRAVEQPDRPYSHLPDRVCELGRFGRKTGAGWYRYDAEGQRHDDPEITALVAAHAAALGLPQREMSDHEIVARCVLALANEGARIVEEGIAQRASDVDAVYRHGYGFPAHRGGPLYQADERGLAAAVAQMQLYAAGYQGQFWHPAPLILRQLRTGARLSAA